MDSPTRRQLVVGFLEPVDKNDRSLNTQSDWIADNFTQKSQPIRAIIICSWAHGHALKSQEGSDVLAVDGNTCFVFSRITLLLLFEMDRTSAFPVRPHCSSANDSQFLYDKHIATWRLLIAAKLRVLFSLRQLIGKKRYLYASLKIYEKCF